MEQHEIAVYEESSPASLQNGIMFLSVEEQNVKLAEYLDRKNNFRKWLMDQLIEGVHYGVPPGCELTLDEFGNIKQWNNKSNKFTVVNRKQWTAKASLYKAGALYLIDILNMQQQYETDLEAWKMLGEPRGTMVRKCSLFNPSNGKYLGSGTGAYVVGTKGMDPNSSIKMADKRAAVAAVINVLAIADLFTQDVDDPADKNRKQPESEQNQANPFKDMLSDWITKDQGIPYSVTDADVNALRLNLKMWCKGKGTMPATPEDALKWVQENTSIEITENADGIPCKLTFVKKSS